MPESDALMPASTAPMCNSKRVKRDISIQEINTPPAPNTFDTTAVYPSDALPEWFRGLQSIVEDETFTDMSINLGGRVCYKITIAGEERTTTEKLAAFMSTTTGYSHNNFFNVEED